MLASCLPWPSIFWTSALVLLMISFLRCSPSLVVLTAMASISEMARSKAASRTWGTNSIRDRPTSTSSMPRPVAWP